MELEQELQNQAISHDVHNRGTNLNANHEENIEDVNAADHQLRAAYFSEKNGEDGGFGDGDGDGDDER